MVEIVSRISQLPSEAELLKIPEAARVLNVSRTAIYRLIRKDELRAVSLMGAQRISRTEINRFLTDLGAL